jgi:DNA polymerase-3 subunit gamma/tau
MAAQALYLKWRPMTFEEVVGQEHVTYTLRNALVSERIGHAYLFAGPRGTGKTTMARVLAKAVNCLADDPQARPCNECQYCGAVNEGRFLDLIEIDAASHTSVDDVRELRDRIAFSPGEGRFKVYIIDEVHRFSGAAFDALLKTIEEPPAHAIFVLATTELHKVPQTIRSRCQLFEFRRIPLIQIMERLQAMIDVEGVQAEPMALDLIARQATGSLRDAISLLDQLTGDPGSMLTWEVARAILGTADSDTIHALTEALIAGDTAAGLDLINRALDQGADPRQFAGQVVEYLRLVMLVQTGGTTLAETTEGPETLGIAEVHARQLARGALLGAIRRFIRAATDSTAGWQPQLPLELAFVESVEAIFAAPAETASPSQEAAPARVRSAERPTAASQAVPAEATSTPAPGTLTVAEIGSRWRDVLRFTRERDKLVEALLNSCSLHGVDGLTIVVQVPSELLRDKMQQEHNRMQIEQALQHVFGEPLMLRCLVGGVQGGGVASGGDNDLLAEDSLAAYAVHELGGKIKRAKNKEESAP